MLQVFESSADYISKEQFELVSLPYCKQIRDKLHERLTSQGLDPVPMVMYAKGGGHSLKEQSELGYEIVGLDWTVCPVEARNIVGPNVTLQGNLDPQDLYKTQVPNDERKRVFDFCNSNIVLAGRTERIDIVDGKEVRKRSLHCKLGPWHYTCNTN